MKDIKIICTVPVCTEKPHSDYPVGYTKFNLDASITLETFEVENQSEDFNFIKLSILDKEVYIFAGDLREAINAVYR